MQNELARSLKTQLSKLFFATNFILFSKALLVHFENAMEIIHRPNEL